jgi:hypothetical protein
MVLKTVPMPPLGGGQDEAASALVGPSVGPISFLSGTAANAPPASVSAIDTVVGAACAPRGHQTVVVAKAKTRLWK